MNTIINTLMINEDNNLIEFNIAAANPTEYVIHNIVIDIHDNITIENGILVPNDEPLDNINYSDIIAYDATQKIYIDSWVTSPTIAKKLVYIFVSYAGVDTPTVAIEGMYDVFCIYNLYDYVQLYNTLTKKITQNNSVPKELLDVMLIRSSIHYAIMSSKYEQALEYFTKLLNYYD